MPIPRNGPRKKFLPTFDAASIWIFEWKKDREKN